MRRQRHEGVARFDLFVAVDGFFSGANGEAVNAVLDGGSPGKMKSNDAPRWQDWHAKLAIAVRPIKLLHMRVVKAGFLLQVKVAKPEIVDRADERLVSLGVVDAAGGPNAALQAKIAALQFVVAHISRPVNGDIGHIAGSQHDQTI